MRRKMSVVHGWLWFETLVVFRGDVPPSFTGLRCVSSMRHHAAPPFVSGGATTIPIVRSTVHAQALRDGGCFLRLEEEARLLDALETEESAR